VPGCWVRVRVTTHWGTCTLHPAPPHFGTLAPGTSAPFYWRAILSYTARA
jgi:hypothetical protein